MTNITIADVLSKLKRDLDWRSPNDKTLGHIVLTRAEAEYLQGWVIRLAIAKDEMEAELERLKCND